MFITECDALCSSVATSTCVDVALLSQSAYEGVEATTTKTIHLDCIPIPYVGFQQLFFKNNVFKPNEILTNQNTYFKQYIENNKRIITSIDHDKCSPHALNTNLNLYKQMSDLYECEAEQLRTCWDTHSKIKFTKSVSKVKNLTDLTSVCPVECALSLDDMFCALEANADDPLTIDPDTNMPEPPHPLGCPPQLSRTDPNSVILCKDQFVYIPETEGYDCDTNGPIEVTLALHDCSGVDCSSNALVVDASQGALVDCYGVTIDSGTILISGIYVDGLYGAGGQYILTTPNGGGHWEVKYWEQSAIVNITTRLNGFIPLLDGGALQAAELEKDISNNTSFTPIQIANKEVVLDIIWKFKVDLTPASSGTGGYGYQNISGGKSYGWSYPKYNMTDDRQRKSLSRPEAIKLMTSVKHISILAKDYRDNLLSCGGASATQSAQSSAQSSESNNDVYALAYTLTLGDPLDNGDTAFTANTIDPNGNPPTLIAYKYEDSNINNGSITNISVQVQRNITVSYAAAAPVTILLIKKSSEIYTILDSTNTITPTDEDINDLTEYQTGWTTDPANSNIKVKTIDFPATLPGWFANENDEIYIGINYPDPGVSGNYLEGNEDAKLLDNYFINDNAVTVISAASLTSSIGAVVGTQPLYLMYYKISIT